MLKCTLESLECAFTHFYRNATREPHARAVFRPLGGCAKGTGAKRRRLRRKGLGLAPMGA